MWMNHIKSISLAFRSMCCACLGGLPSVHYLGQVPCKKTEVSLLSLHGITLIIGITLISQSTNQTQKIYNKRGKAYLLQSTHGEGHHPRVEFASFFLVMLFTNPLMWVDSPFTMTYLNGEGPALYANVSAKVARAINLVPPARIPHSITHRFMHD